jgi:uncharacterized RDD family membrane protein YckC
MAKLNVKTNFNTKLSFDTDTLGKRIVAYFIDLIILAIYVVLVIYVFSAFNLDIADELEQDSGRISWGLVSVLSLPILFYTLVSETVSGGYTIGKFLVKLKVVKIDGFQPSFVEFFVRWIFRMVDIYFITIIAISFGSFVGQFLSIYMLGLVAIITIARNKRGQRVGDLVAGTAVIQAKVKQSINITILKEVSEDYIPQYSQVLRFSDNDARIIKETYENAIKINDTQLINKLVAKLESVMNIKSTTSPRLFISTVLKDFNYYTQNM